MPSGWFCCFACIVQAYLVVAIRHVLSVDPQTIQLFRFLPIHNGPKIVHYGYCTLSEYVSFFGTALKKGTVNQVNYGNYWFQLRKQGHLILLWNENFTINLHCRSQNHSIHIAYKNWDSNYMESRHHLFMSEN